MTDPRNRGEQNARAILDKDRVLAIKRLLAQNYKHREIADVYGISRQTVTAISNGLRWGWVEPEDDDTPDS